MVGDVPNFQMVGSVIDVATKIYAARVDELYQNTNHVLSCLVNSSKDQDINSNIMFF